MVVERLPAFFSFEIGTCYVTPGASYCCLLSPPTAVATLCGLLQTKNTRRVVPGRELSVIRNWIMSEKRQLLD